MAQRNGLERYSRGQQCGPLYRVRVTARRYGEGRGFVATRDTQNALELIGRCLVRALRWV
jgi:hypothetical protein